MDQTTPITVGGQRGGPQHAARAFEGLTDPPRSLYVHVPFCFHKCHYCDFYSFVDSQDRQAPFTSALITELRTLAQAVGGRPALDTIFVGGGTPTLLEPQHWERLLSALHEAFDINERAEWTVECNPETATPELMTLLASGGVNRISVGAQSFNEAHLKTLERWHDPASVPRAIECAHRAGIRRVSADLIYAIPGQTAHEWARDLEQAIALGTGHISAYALTYEPNTAMTERLRQGRFEPASEELEAEFFVRTREVLAQVGIEWYEVSNFASSDPETGGPCAHNLAYWRQEQWLAAGPSASAHINGHRWKNIPRLTDWMRSVESAGGWSSVVDFEGPDATRALAERIMTTLRLREGLDLHAAIADAGDRAGALTQEVEKQERLGNVRSAGGRLVLTDAGMLFADGIAAQLMGALDG